MSVRFRCCAILAFVTMVWGGDRSADAQETAKAPSATITATGTATIDVEPDSMKLTLSVQTSQSTIKDARSINATDVKKLNEAIAKLKIAGLKTAVTTGSVQQSSRSSDAGFRRGGGVPQANPNDPPTIDYYISTKLTLVAKAEDAEKLHAVSRSIMDVAIQNGASVSSTPTDDFARRFSSRGGPRPSAPRATYFKENVADVRRQALAAAVKDAMANAKALAGGAKITIQSITMLDVSEGDRVRVPTRSSGRTSAAEMAALLAAARETNEITATVRVVCTFVP